MSWSDRLMASLDERATMLFTARGDAQLAREGQGPPVLAIHGGPGGFDLGLAWCRHLRDGGCEVLAPSRPGYLRTPLESGRSPESQADLYAAILDLFLDTAILLPFKPPINAIQRATIESSFVVWLSYQIAGRRPKLMTSFSVAGTSEGLDKEQKMAAVDWITSCPARLESLQEQFASIAPPTYRRAGWTNDLANEAGLAPLPFADITAPTLIAHGTNDGIVPLEHSTNAANKIAGAELILVEEGHHLLSASRNYGSVVQRQRKLAHR